MLYVNRDDNDQKKFSLFKDESTCKRLNHDPTN